MPLPFCYHARMKNPTRYLDTRGLITGPKPTFTEAVISGIAPGGGLFVPESLPAVGLPEILAFAEMPYWRRAAAIFDAVRRRRPRRAHRRAHAAGVRRASGTTSASRRCVRSSAEHARARAVARPHERVQGHGAAVHAAVLLRGDRRSVAGARRADDDYLILVATSGDTGKAALEGFADRPHTRIVVFYPAEGVSDIQRKQMVTQRGENVGVFGVRGNFDDCQNAVKAAFNDEAFNAELHETARPPALQRELHQLGPAAAADRLLRERVRRHGRLGRRACRASRWTCACPPATSATSSARYYAREIGVPIGRLLCASNENNVLADFIATGVYDISDRAFVTTPSPRMDILISSNLERLLYELADAERVREWMADLAESRRFQVDRDTFGQLRELLVRRLRDQRRVARDHPARVGRARLPARPAHRGRVGGRRAACAATTRCSSSRPRTGRSSAPTSTERSRACRTEHAARGGARADRRRAAREGAGDRDRRRVRADERSRSWTKRRCGSPTWSTQDATASRPPLGSGSPRSPRRKELWCASPGSPCGSEPWSRRSPPSRRSGFLRRSPWAPSRDCA